MICETVHVQVAQCTKFVENVVWNEVSVDGKFARNKDDADN